MTSLPESKIPKGRQSPKTEKDQKNWLGLQKLNQNISSLRNPTRRGAPSQESILVSGFSPFQKCESTGTIIHKTWMKCKKHVKTCNMKAPQAAKRKQGFLLSCPSLAQQPTTEASSESGSSRRLPNRHPGSFRAISPRRSSNSPPGGAQKSPCWGLCRGVCCLGPGRDCSCPKQSFPKWICMRWN